ncbi:hypothetical protein P3W45_001754 [Vairimorpha bombi]|jgi:hypothetical protein
MFQTIQRKFRELKNNIFSQEVKGHFVPTNLSKHFPILLVLGLTSLVLGMLMTHTYYNLYEKIIPYNKSTTLSVYLPPSKIYFYIQIEDFYQTNLKYSKSISYKQLKGEKDTNSNHTEPLDSKGGRDYYPAGILPNTFFQDIFSINNLDIQTRGISWESMRKRIEPSEYTLNEIRNPPLWEKYKEVPDLRQNERFVNWIYTAPFYNFRKLWGIIDVQEGGVYDMEIVSTYPYGKKNVVFSEVSWAGTKNYFLSISLIVIGFAGLIFSGLLFKKMFD